MIVKKIEILIVLFCVVAVVGCGKSKPSSAILFETETKDVGTLREGDTVDLVYNFTNAGKKSLRILSVEPTCECVTIKRWDRRVSPGNSGKVVITLDTTGLEGEIFRVVNVATNVPGQEKFLLIINGIVEVPVKIIPGSLDLGVVADFTSPLNGSFTIKNSGKAPLEIVKITPPDEQVSYNLTEVVPGFQFKLDFTVAPPFRRGQYVKKTITVKIGGDVERTYDLSYIYKVLPSIEISPAMINLDLKKLKTEKIEEPVSIISNIDKPISILEPALTATGVEYPVEEVIKGKSYVINLVFPAGFTFPENEYNLFLTFRVENDPVSRLHTVSINGYVP